MMGKNTEKTELKNRITSQMYKKIPPSLRGFWVGTSAKVLFLPTWTIIPELISYFKVNSHD
jgi:hypothetical protein